MKNSILRCNICYKNKLKRNGLKKGELTIEENAILDIIRYYTREAGVRD